MSGKWRRYPAYRESGVEWIGQTPSGWEVMRLANVAEKIQTGPFGSQLHAGEYSSGGVPVINPANIRDGKLIADPECAVDQEKSCHLAKHRLSEGDIVFARRGEMGRCGLVTRLEAGWLCGTGSLLVRSDKSKCSPEFLNQLLSTRGVREWLSLESVGSTMENLNTGILGRIPMPLPPAAEQRAIAAFLDQETAKIDALVAKKERLIELLQEKRTALISHAVTRGLNPNAPLRDSGIPWIGRIPQHWEVKRMKWSAKLESGHTPDKKIEAYWTNSDIPWVSLADTGKLRADEYIAETEYRTNRLGLAHSSARLLPQGTVVFSRDASIGLCAITTRPMAVSQHFIGWVCGTGITPEFLLFVIRSMTAELDNLTMGATVKTIGMTDVKRLTSPVPPTEEQTAIVAHIRTSVAKLDALIAKVRTAIDRLQEYRTALISAAVTGQIDVREQG